MELNWELCRIFYQVARCRNFSRAAAMLFTSQPAVSRSMAALERELGCRLFIRNRRGVELTPEGRMFYALVEAGCEQFRRGREELEQAVGLIMRPAPGKNDALVYDFIDDKVPTCRSQYAARRRVYKQLNTTILEEIAL